MSCMVACRFGLVLLAAVSFRPLAAAEALPKGLPAIEPTAAAMDGRKLARIPLRMREFVAEKQIAGAVTLVARRGGVVHFEGDAAMVGRLVDVRIERAGPYALVGRAVA